MTTGYNRLLLAVRGLVEDRIHSAACVAGVVGDLGALAPGKMLRTRLAARLVAADEAVAGDLPSVLHACAATELFHAASLCHDDVIDNAYLRRGQIAFWTATSVSGAVLIGDLLLSEAIELLRTTNEGRHLGTFMSKIQQVLRAETEQELLLRGRRLDTETCLRLCRGKTGPLFAFVAGVCAGEDRRLCGDLEEAGYRLGTAYQLADDLLDVVGTGEQAGKTLGTDSARGKYTLAQGGEEGRRRTERRIVELCASALACLRGRPVVRDALEQFLLLDLQPVLDRYPSVRMELAV